MSLDFHIKLQHILCLESSNVCLKVEALLKTIRIEGLDRSKQFTANVFVPF